MYISESALSKDILNILSQYCLQSEEARLIRTFIKAYIVAFQCIKHKIIDNTKQYSKILQRCSTCSIDIQ